MNARRIRTTLRLTRSANPEIYRASGSDSLSTEPAKTVQQLIGEDAIAADHVPTGTPGSIDVDD